MRENFHNDLWIKEKLVEHYKDAIKKVDPDHIVGLFLQGSQNYGMDTENSDVDTKLIVTPTLDDLIFNRKPLSYTFIRDNDEHIDIKDIRLYMEMFRKQNINMVEILFTPYFYINPTLYCDEWKKLWDYAEDIGRYDQVRAVKAMTGVALEKYHAMEHRYPSKIAIIDKYGYDPKQLSHLLRIFYFMSDYFVYELPYAECLRPKEAEYLVDVKQGLYNLEDARTTAKWYLDHILEMEKIFKEKNFEINGQVDLILNEVQSNIITTSIQNDFKRKEKNNG